MDKNNASSYSVVDANVNDHPPGWETQGDTFFALMLNNNNNNPANNPKDISTARPPPVSDTVQVTRSSTVLELLDNTMVESVDKTNDSSHSVMDADTENPPSAWEAQGDDAILFALLLNNNNNNPANNPKDPNYSPPVSDTVQVLRSSVVLELHDNTTADDLKTPRKGNVYQQFARNASQTSAKAVSISHEGMIKEEKPQSLSALGQDQLNFWHRNGYLVITDAIDQGAVCRLLASVMDTTERLFKNKDSMVRRHDIDSVERGPNPSGRVIATLLNDKLDMSLDLEPIQRVRRLGIGAHRVIPAFRSAVFTQNHADIAASLGFQDPRVTQSIIITKASGTGVPVVPHQDGSSNFTDPPSGVTFWYALQDANEENGCLQVAPGSHRSEPITHRCRSNDEGFAELVKLNVPIFAGDPKVQDYMAPERQADGRCKFVRLPVKAGTLILMHSNLLHQSEPNHSSKHRIAYNFAVVEGKLPWPNDAYIRPYPGQTEFEKLEAK